MSERLKLNTPENLALFLGLVPDWPTLCEDLDLTTDEGRLRFQQRTEAAFNEALENLGQIERN